VCLFDGQLFFGFYFFNTKATSVLHLSDVCHFICTAPHSPPEMRARLVHALPHNYIHNRVPIGYNGTPQIQPQNRPFPSMIITPFTTLIPQPTPLTILNGILIYSAVLPQYTFWTDRHADRPTDGLGNRSVRIPRTLAILIDSDMQ